MQEVGVLGRKAGLKNLPSWIGGVYLRLKKWTIFPVAVKLGCARDRRDLESQTARCWPASRERQSAPRLRLELIDSITTGRGPQTIDNRLGRVINLRFFH